MSAVLLEEQDYSVHLDDVLPRMGNGSLVHSAYYDDDEVIDRIAGFIARHARKTTDDIELELAMKEIQDSPTRSERLPGAPLHSCGSVSRNSLLPARSSHASDLSLSAAQSL